MVKITCYLKEKYQPPPERYIVATDEDSKNHTFKNKFNEELYILYDDNNKRYDVKGQIIEHVWYEHTGTLDGSSLWARGYQIKFFIKTSQHQIREQTTLVLHK